MLELNIHQVLGELNLDVEAQLSNAGITAIFGVSGAGKTSLINVISGIEPLQQGRIVLNGRILADSESRVALPPEKRRIGYVFQDARLFPHYRVKGNLQYGMAASMRTHFDAIVYLLGIESLLSRFPLTLSGGEKQRVAIGRALLTAPELLLMDEPLASLDLPRKRELQPYLERLAREVNIPILYVSHSLDEIMHLANQVMILDQGQVRAFGSIEDVWASSALRPWLQGEERSSVLQVSVLEHHQRYDMTALLLGDKHIWVSRIDAAPETPLRIRINAADVSLTLSPPMSSSIRNIVQAKVLECVAVDGQIDVKLAIGPHILWSAITPWARDELAIKQGQWLYAQIKSVSISRENISAL